MEGCFTKERLVARYTDTVVFEHMHVFACRWRFHSLLPSWWCGGEDSRKHLARPRTSRAEGGRVLRGMVLRRRRMRGCRREVMCRRRGKSMRRTAVHAAIAWNCIRADGSGCGACGGSIHSAAARETAAATVPVFRWSRPRDRLAATKTRVAPPLEAQGCAFSETGVSVVKGTASPDVTVRKLTSTFLRGPRGQKINKQKDNG